ncbi:hypothetical protein [Aneurinibacillus terranovensis]|uniref:hypothetical protein n=1 Tax=Aneurinibacillus terranovensis TaxID=278991 RepID=UPI0004284B7E|nr:hypothetical protein [Aneurinibacillus terranovensis]
MRVPSGRYLRRYMRFLMVFIFGMITGMSVFLLLLGGQLDALHLKIRELEKHNVLYVEQIATLKKNEKNMILKQKRMVKEIKVHITTSNRFVAAELEKQISRDLVFLKGKPLEYVEGFHEALSLMLAERKYHAEQVVYTASLKTLIISPTLQVYITVKPDKI